MSPQRRGDDAHIVAPAVETQMRMVATTATLAAEHEDSSARREQRRRMLQTEPDADAVENC